MGAARGLAVAPGLVRIPHLPGGRSALSNNNISDSSNNNSSNGTINNSNNCNNGNNTNSNNTYMIIII